ncbi:MAG: hypothetical protein NTW87_33505 [Planctomycetota bacterium]|nr:hypothetical protein [Planctomycetota bacterium]
MADDELPPDLRGLEAILASRPGPDAGGAVRARILAAVHRELAAKERRTRWSFWRFAAGLAALVLLGLNLSSSAVHDTEFSVGRTAGAQDDQAAVAQIRDLLPGCSEEEARRHVLLLRARARLVSAPELRHARPGAGDSL